MRALRQRAMPPPDSPDEVPAERPSSLSRLLRGVQIVLSVLLIVLVVRAVDWKEFAAAVRSADPSLLGIAFVLFVLDRVLMAYKWGLLLRVQGLRVRLREAWSIYSAASFASTILPSTVGADMLRAAWTWRRGLGSDAAVATVIMERAIGFLASLFFTTLGLLYLSVASKAFAAFAAYRWVALALWISACGLLVLSFDPRFQARLIRRLPTRAASRFARWFGRFASSYAAFGTAKRKMVLFSLLTMAEQLLTYGMTYLIALALGIDVGPWHFVAACSVAFLMSRLPVSLDGLGVLEGVTVLLLGPAGVAAAPSVAFAWLTRILAILSYAFGAAFAFFFSDFTFRDLRRGMSRGRDA